MIQVSLQPDKAGIINIGNGEFFRLAVALYRLVVVGFHILQGLPQVQDKFCLGAIIMDFHNVPVKSFGGEEQGMGSGYFSFLDQLLQLSAVKMIFGINRIPVPGAHSVGVNIVFRIVNTLLQELRTIPVQEILYKGSSGFGWAHMK